MANNKTFSIIEEMVQSQFVNRKKELCQVEELIRSDNMLGILSVSGDGGAGKTWFMIRAIQQAAENERILCIDPIDFYITSYHSADGVREKISELLGNQYFGDYHRAMSDLAKGQHADQSQETIGHLEYVVQTSFVENYNKLAEKWDKVLVSFDTFEVIQDETVGRWLITELIPNLQRTVVLISGRRNKVINFGSLQDSVTFSDLGEVEENDAQMYFSRKGITDIPGDVVKKLWEKTDGRPLLMDLVIDWLKENINYQTLLDTPREKFEEELVARIRGLREVRYRAILYMSWAYRRLDLEMLKWLMQDESVDYSALAEDLTSLSFVKYRESIRSILLHDEMRNLVVKHVWGVVDPSATERQNLSRRIINYYDQYLIPRAADENELQNLKAERLFFTLYLDLGKGYENFTEVFDKLFAQYRHADCEVLLVEIGFYRDRLPLERIGEVDLRHADLLLQRNRLGEAEEKLLHVLNNYPESNLKISMLLALGNIFTRKSRIRDAIEYSEKAREICDRVDIAPATITRIEDRLGYFYRLLGRWDDAIKIHEAALGKATEPSVISNMLNTLGYIYALKTDYDTAIEYCENGLRIRENLGHKKGQGLSWSTLGEIYRYKANYKQALECYENALQVFLEGDDQENIARIRQQRGMCLVEMGKLEDAYLDLKKSEEFYLNSGNVRDYPRCLERLGRFYFAQNDYSQSQTHFEKAYQAAQGSDVDTAVYCIVWMARLALIAGEPTDKIISYLQQLERLVEEHGYQNPQHHGQLSIILGHALFRETKFDVASKFYASGMAEIAAQHRGDYLIKENLKNIETRMKDLPPETIVQWAQTFKNEWRDDRVANLHPELVRFCEIKDRLARTRLIGRSAQ